MEMEKQLHIFARRGPYSNKVNPRFTDARYDDKICYYDRFECQSRKHAYINLTPLNPTFIQ